MYICISHHQTVHLKYIQLEKEGLKCPETGTFLYIQGDPGSERGKHARRSGQRGGVEVRGSPAQQCSSLAHGGPGPVCKFCHGFGGRVST